MTSTFLQPLRQRPGMVHRLLNQRTQRVVAERVIPAIDSRSRRAGLLAYDAFPDRHAMVIAPSNAVHTFFMRFPIDLAFVTRDGRIVKTCAAVRPWRVAAALRGWAVVELPAGTLAESGTVAGDTLELVPAATSLT